MVTKQRTAVAALVLSAVGFVGIANKEAFRGKAYDDGLGIPTYGFGTTEGVKMGDTITVEKALTRALTDMSKFEDAARKCVKVPLHQYEYDAYVSFAYNVGAGNFCGSTLVKKLNVGDYAGACAELSKWVCGKSKRGPGRVLTDEEKRTCPTSAADAARGLTSFPMRGLVIRREDERKTCEGRQ